MKGGSIIMADLGSLKGEREHNRRRGEKGTGIIL
jgi:hypothetical protein